MHNGSSSCAHNVPAQRTEGPLSGIPCPGYRHPLPLQVINRSAPLLGCITRELAAIQCKQRPPKQCHLLTDQQYILKQRQDLLSHDFRVCPLARDLYFITFMMFSDLSVLIDVVISFESCRVRVMFRNIPD